jgi:alpha-mannosidase
MASEGLRNLERDIVTKIEQRTAEIGRHVWTENVAVTDVALAETIKHLTPDAARRLRYRRVKPGRRWGRPWSTGWFRLRIRVPRGFRGEAVSLLFKPNGESIIFRDGEPLQALDGGRSEYLLLDRARGGERIELFVEAGASSAFGRFETRVMEEPRIALFLREVWDAWMDADALAQMIALRGETLPRDDTRRARITFALNKAVDLFDYHDTSREGLRASAGRVRRALRGVYARRANASAQTVACMGHAHIDVAWLWPLAETKRKCGRTFSNMLELMERYPNFVFCQSQPQLYVYTRRKYPGLYRRIRAMVRKGQWVPTGAMWVESDTNVTGGESLVRQVLFGTRFFQKEFGVRPACLWLPDVFGYSAALPQILKRSGIDYFLTQKISWNQYTTFPHHTFHWEGLDGSRVLSHFLADNNYNGALRPEQQIGAERRYRQKDRSPIRAALFGHGDGGGGPTKEMLERMRRYRDLEGTSKHVPMSPRAFFRRLDRESHDLPSWVGELYLERHRGTYTTQARTKQLNRRCELLLRETEALCALHLAHGGRYPGRDLRAAWEKVLLNQFHDVIPGSSITRVYEEAEQQYGDVIRTAEPLRDAAVDRVAARADTRGEGAPVVAFNALSWERRDVVAVDAGKLRGRRLVAAAPDGSETPVQVGRDGKARFRGRVPAFGHAVFHLRPGRAPAPEMKATERLLENDCVRVRFDRRGRVASVYDKRARREAVAEGQAANVFQLFEDKPIAWDAWDVDIFYGDKPLEIGGRLLSARVVERGPVQSVVRFRRAISKSVVTQDVVLHAGSPQVDFVTTVAWGDERDVLLKVAFPVAVRAERARYEVQFGNVERPTHWNMPRDFARFEVCGHRWVDLSEGDYGVALLNDCKYGHDARDNVMRLTLLRAPKHPDPSADVNRTHTFTYALLPHAGGYAEGGVVRAGYGLNVPVTARPAKASRGAWKAEGSWLGVSGDNVVIETVKKAEDDRGIIVRLYEAHGCRGRRTLATALPVKRAVETDLMEKEERRLPLRNGRVTLHFRPFQIRTVKLI